jgi:hypothetical protein
MREQRRNQGMPGPGPARYERPATVEQAVALRAEAVTLAAQSADRAERAKAAAQYGLARYWLREYRRATSHCRRLGEQIRQEGGPGQLRREVDDRGGAREGLARSGVYGSSTRYDTASQPTGRDA